MLRLSFQNRWDVQQMTRIRVDLVSILYKVRSISYRCRSAACVCGSVGGCARALCLSSVLVAILQQAVHHSVRMWARQPGPHDARVVFVRSGRHSTASSTPIGLYVEESHHSSNGSSNSIVVVLFLLFFCPGPIFLLLRCFP